MAIDWTRRVSAGSISLTTSGVAAATGYLSVFRHISLTMNLVFLAMAGLAVFSGYRRQVALPRLLLNIVALLVTVFFLLRFNLSDPARPIVEWLLFLLGVKLVEEKKVRDHLQIIMLAIFLLAGSALLSLDMVFMAFFLFMVFFLPLSLVLLVLDGEAGGTAVALADVRDIVKASALMPLAAVPVIFALFVVMPRTGYPFFYFLNKGSAAQSGFTDTVTLGAISGIQESANVIFRAKMEKVNESQLYWRGIVLDSFDGRNWNRSVDAIERSRRLQMTGQVVKQTIFIEAYDSNYLFALDKPASFAVRSVDFKGDLTASLYRNVDRRMRYDAVSILSDEIPVDLVNRDRYLKLPARTEASLKDRAAQLAGGKAAGDVVRAVMGFLKEGGFRYGLTDIPISESPVEDFLLVHKYGNCEYFASSMAVLLRLAGVPSRIVGGYLGGYYNEMGGYYIIPQKNAHVWVEAYIDGRGWVRCDPTPASLSSFVNPDGQNLLLRMRIMMDAMNYFWYNFVLTYDLERQFGLFNEVASRVRPAAGYVRPSKRQAGGVIALAAMLVLMVIVARKKPWRTFSFESMLVNGFLRRMAGLGYRRKKAEGLEEFAERIEDRAVREQALTFVRAVESRVYRDRRIGFADYLTLRRMMKNGERVE